MFNSYCNFRAKFGKLKIIKRREKTKKTSKEAADDVNPFASEERSLEVLKTKISPWNEVKQNWKETYEYRQTVLNSSKLSTAQYLTDFLCLSQPNGYELVS